MSNQPRQPRHSPPTSFAIPLLLALVALLGLASPGRAAVSGKLVVAGKTYKITQAYAWAEKGFFDPKKQDIVVVLCDAEVAPAALHDRFARRDLAKAGKLHCVEQTIDADQQVINFTIQHEMFKKPESGGSTFQVFEAKTFDGKTIAGRSRTTAPQKSFDDVVYSYDIKFSLPITPMK